MYQDVKYKMLIQLYSNIRNKDKNVVVVVVVVVVVGGVSCI
jgi:hypothetical protein